MSWNYDPTDPMSAFDDHYGRPLDAPTAGDAFEHELGVTMNPRIYEVGFDLLTFRLWSRGLAFRLVSFIYEDGDEARSLFGIERASGNVLIRLDLCFVHAIDR